MLTFGINGAIMLYSVIFISFLHLFAASEVDVDGNKYQVSVVTVATEATDGFNRYVRSADYFQIPVNVLGFGEKWTGGNVRQYMGGGKKVNLFKNSLKKYKDDDDRIILFTDSYDVIFLAPLEEIIAKFLKTNSRILFSAEVYCWPDETLADKYPDSDPEYYPYLNSGLIIGFAKDLYEVIESRDDIKDNDDDQLFYTQIYLDPMLRKQYNIKLDGTSDLFINLNGIAKHVSVIVNNTEIYLKNTHFDTRPMIAHGNGVSKIRVNSIGNYLPNSWSPVHQCIECLENIMFLDALEEKPLVLMNIFIEDPTAFLEEFFDQIEELKYPKKRIHLCIHNKVGYHKELVDQFIVKVSGYYHGIKVVDSKVEERDARNIAFNHCREISCDFVFVIDSDARIDEPFSIEMLIEQNRTVLAPLLHDSDPDSLMTNFWGALNSNGFYLRSSDYIAITNGSRNGVWNVPYVSKSYLINMTRFKNIDFEPYTSGDDLDPDMSFCKNLRDRDIFMYVTNRYVFGHLVNHDDFNVNRIAPEMYTIRKNLRDWIKRYIHEDYYEILNGDILPQQPCTDVYWFPIVKKRLCKDLLAIVENHGKWSSGRHDDDRITGGYEAVPTRDIHMRQVGLHDQWNYFLNKFVNPLAKLVYDGYNDDASAIMNFVVRYKLDEQPSLRPHHDSSTYTINIALNEKGIDYDGGGCRFVRYNCSVVQTKIGWMLMHPGRLTHLHEGLPISDGIRYIMISFVNP